MRICGCTLPLTDPTACSRCGNNNSQRPFQLYGPPTWGWEPTIEAIDWIKVKEIKSLEDSIQITEI